MVKQSRRREKELLEAKVCARALTELQTPSIKLKPGANTGWPDREFFIIGGVPLLIEFKWPGYEPDPRQDYIHDMLRELGYDVQVHDSEDAAVEAIRMAVEKAVTRQRNRRR